MRPDFGLRRQGPWSVYSQVAFMAIKGMHEHLCETTISEMTFKKEEIMFLNYCNLSL